ncbi:FliM/FliN family flagellar motor switch protein [Roseivivax isoporae]|uniref:Flagellar motor switch protein FliN n=1 Tax=Roseivivax isoporae LMG 25204 TaxID=1449351 RepID=X7F7X7_9RHOB|nr:FliM/FliN family flagellar motor switch protein [Roseivivax isoporae]ETX28905.1 hypothetical protein RISW2_04120 [Roseivivax isoporae LMG 25204]
MSDDRKTSPRGKPAEEPREASAGVGVAEAPAAADDATGDQDFGATIPEFDESQSVTTTAKPEGDGVAGRSIQAMLNVDLEVKVVLGDCRMPISTLLKLTRGSVIELDQRIGEPVELVVNDRLVARGELVKLAGDRIGVSLTEIVRDHVSEF